MERVMGLETEYSIMEEIDGGVSEIAFKAMLNYLRLTCDEFLPNGGRLYRHRNVNVMEYCTPECKGLKDLLTYIKAGDSIISDIAKEGECEFVKCSHFRGSQLASHENYSMQYEKQKIKRIFNLGNLVPFLITRVLWSGAGELTYKGFSIIQRYFPGIFSGKPGGNSLIRVHADLKEKNFLRLHIAGETNLSDFANYLKFGATSIVIGLIEKGLCPRLDIYRAIDFWSGLRNGRLETLEEKNIGKISALDIQEIYLEAAKKAFNDLELDDEYLKVLEMWEFALEKLKTDYEALFGVVDWVTKKILLEHFAEKELGMCLEEAIKNEDHFVHLKSIEWEPYKVKESLLPPEEIFGETSKKWGINVSSGSVIRAKNEPPKDTRAYARGKVVKKYLEGKENFEISEWDKCSFKEKVLSLENPHESYAECVEEFLKNAAI